MADNSRVTFVDAVASGFRRGRDIRGRASRAEFWYWILFTVLIGAVLSTADSIFLPPTVPMLPENAADITATQLRTFLDGMVHDTVWSFSSLADVILFVPTIAVTIRRFRDAGSRSAFAWVAGLSIPVTTVLVLWLGFFVTDHFAGWTTGTPSPEVGIGLVGMLLTSAVNLTAYILILVVALRPSVPANTTSS